MSESKPKKESILTKELAACSIFGIQANEENKEKSVQCLEETGLVPVYVAEGDPNHAIAVEADTADQKPSVYRKFKSEKET